MDVPKKTNSDIESRKQLSSGLLHPFIPTFFPNYKSSDRKSYIEWEYPLKTKIPKLYDYATCQSLLEFSYRVDVHDREDNDGNKNPLELDPPEFDVIIPLNTTFLLTNVNVLWFFYSSSMNIVVITATATYSNLLFLVDANYLQVDPTIITNYKPNMRVHGGIWELYSNIRSNLFSLLEKYVNNSTQVIVTGISLGGGLSTIMALDMYQYKLSTGVIINDLVHYSFASPRTFNTSGSNDYNQLDIPSYRICNGSDIIPISPLPIMPFSVDPINKQDFTHVQKLIYFDRNLSDYYDNHILAYLQEYNVTPVT